VTISKVKSAAIAGVNMATAVLAPVSAAVVTSPAAVNG
jgi:hypothetical protein